MRTQEDHTATRTSGAGDGPGDVRRSALEARDLIAEAKAVVMSRLDLDADEAFELLRQYSRTCDRPLRDVALRVVHGTWVAEA